MNWCKVLGHKIEDISNGENVQNVGVCERCQHILQIDPDKPWHYMSRADWHPSKATGWEQKS